MEKLPSQIPFQPHQYILGRVAIPPHIAMKKSKPFFYSGSTGTIPLSGSGTVTIQIHDDAHFLVEGIQIIVSSGTSGVTAGIDQNKFTCQITDNSNSQSWSNEPVPIRDLAGLGLNAKYLSDPNILRPGSSITLQFFANVDGQSSVYVVLVGRKIYGLSQSDVALLTRRMWYQYVLTVPSLAAGAVNVKNELQILSDSDFMVKRLMSEQMITQIVTYASGEILCQIKDTVNNAYLTDDFIPARAIFGDMAGLVSQPDSFRFSVGFPQAMTRPWLLRRNGRLQVTLNSTMAANITSSMAITFEGIRIFEASEIA